MAIVDNISLTPCDLGFQKRGKSLNNRIIENVSLTGIQKKYVCRNKYAKKIISISNISNYSYAFKYKIRVKTNVVMAHRHCVGQGRMPSSYDKHFNIIHRPLRRGLLSLVYTEIRIFPVPSLRVTQITQGR